VVADAHDWFAGDVIAARYRLSEVVGSGGMGAVWRALDVESGSVVAVKLLHEDLRGRADSRDRFIREARTIRALRGSNLVEILDTGVEEGTPFFVMELLAGESLAERLARVRTLSPAATVALVADAARALGRAHEHGIVHRDVKPANLFLVRGAAGADDVKLLDFGIAKALDDAPISRVTLTVPGTALGTAAYMSPEQARGTHELDHRADLWALGVVAFQCLVGALPLVRATFGDLVLALHTEPMPVPSALVPTLPRAFDTWFARATRRSPDDRFQSAAELSSALSAALG
jgi:serine/threonine protein kinase